MLPPSTGGALQVDGVPDDGGDDRVKVRLHRNDIWRPGGGFTGLFETYRTPPDRLVPVVATEDIGTEVARLLVGGWSGKIVELGSPIGPDHLARAMGEVLGRPVRARSIPREQWTASLQSQDMPPGFAGPFEDMQEALNSGWIGFGVPGAEPLAGKFTPAQVFEQAEKPDTISDRGSQPTLLGLHIHWAGDDEVFATCR